MYTIHQYPDGSSYVETDFETDETFRINSYDDLWKLGQLVDAKNSLGIKPLITIPTLLDAQADRRFDCDQSFGLKLVIKFLAGLEAHFKIFHPHNPEVVEMGFELLGKPVSIIDNSDFIEDVVTNIASTIRREDDSDYVLQDNLVLMSADAGGFKPLMKTCDAIGWRGETISASKSRTWDGEKSSLSQFLPDYDWIGKDVLIIDDLCVRGGTFKGLAKLLAERGVRRAFLAVSHITLELLGDDPVTNYFDRVYTTNSKYENFFAKNRKGDGGFQPRNLKVLRKFNQ